MALVILLLLLSSILIGLYLVYLGVRLQKSSLKLGLLHAALALAGATLLFVVIANGPNDKMNNFAAFFLLLALIGGSMVFMLREQTRPPSMMMVTMHAIMGLTGTGILLAKLL